MSTEHLIKFLENEISRHRKIRDEYFKTKNISLLRTAGKPQNLPPEVLSANIYVEAYTRIVNFLNDPTEDIAPLMSSEGSLSIATTLFLKEANKEFFIWSHSPNKKEWEEKIAQQFNDDNFAEKFNLLIYYWYYFQRNKKQPTTPEAA